VEITLTATGEATTNDATFSVKDAVTTLPADNLKVYEKNGEIISEIALTAKEVLTYALNPTKTYVYSVTGVEGYEDITQATITAEQITAGKVEITLTAAQ